MHDFSAFNAKLPASITSHPANLEVIEAKKNESKGYKSSLTIESLLCIINRDDIYYDNQQTVS